MHATVAPALVDSPTPQSEDVLGAIAALTGPVPQVELTYEVDIRTLWITLKPEPKPVFTLPIIGSVRKVQHAIMKRWSSAADPPVLFFAYRAIGPIFSLGGDLDFYLDCLRDNNRAGLLEYASLAAEVICLNHSGLNGRVISLAMIQGKAVGGGIDPARACNLVVAEQAASFTYPEINYNHFPISAVPVLSRYAGPIEAKRILMSGAEYSAAEFLDRGVLDAVVPDHDGENWVRRYSRQNRASHGARVALFAAISRQQGNLEAELSRAVEIWTDHMIRLKPLAISKLQRITQAQERMLARMAHRESASHAMR